MASEVIARSASHFLTRDEDGWALWGVDQDDDDPLLTFPPDPSGEERARAVFEIRTRETRRVRWLAVAAVVAGVAWIAIEVASAVYERVSDSRGIFIDPERGYEVRMWLQSLGGLAYPVFIVAVGGYLVAWLHRRWRREG